MKASKNELFYDSIADNWDQIITYKVETSKRIRIIFDDLLSEIDLKDKKFLDAGCGLGFFSKRAFSKKAKVTGIDIGGRLIARCKKTIPGVNFMNGSVTRMPFDDKSFDIVLSTEVIEHVEDPVDAIQELFRVVKPNGYIVLTTPNKVFKPLFDLLSFCKVRSYQGNENWLFPWHLKEIINKNGGKIEKERYFNFIFPNKFLDIFEKYGFIKYLMINQGFLIKN